MSFAPDNQQPLRYLVVRVAGRLCALPLAAVIEVLRVPPVDAGDGRTAGLLGFATLRGEPSAVFALDALFGLGDAAAVTAQDARAVRIRVAGGSAAVVVDEVLGLREIEAAQLARIDLPGGGERHLGRFDEDFASILELSGLLPAEMPVSDPLPNQPLPGQPGERG